MAIYVNLNVVMAQRRISSQELAAQVGGYHPGQPFHFENRESQGHSLQHPGRHL